MSGTTQAARLLRVRGVVQGVGFRPFVLRLATALGLAGWVRNGSAGVEIHLEGPQGAIDAFTRELETAAPPAAAISALESRDASPAGFREFAIVESLEAAAPTARISPDLPVCDHCVAELMDPADRRHGHPYISCSDCGPRHSIVTGLPYDRARTTMEQWPMCAACAREYADPADRRFHVQPIACPRCGPRYALIRDGRVLERDTASIRAAARLLLEGLVVAVKGIGGYHLACDAHNDRAVRTLRKRKFRKEKPFALMARDLDAARALVHLTADAEAILVSPARPIVLAPGRVRLPLVAPDTDDLGVMLPYSPVHHLLFASGAPDVLVLTSANRSSEPIAYEDADALARLSGIADAFLVGERPIARRVEDSVARVGTLGPQLLRRSRGYAPAPAARVPLPFPALALGADLKNAVTLVVDGEAFVSQHIGDLEHAAAAEAFGATVRDLLAIYEVDADRLVVAHDLHPQYASTRFAGELPARARHAVQHHRAHVASVLAERRAFETRALGVAFDGTGYGDDGSIWGGEFFAGSIVEGFRRVAHLRTAMLAGGDAAARHPVQAAAGFLVQLDALPDLALPPFGFPRRFEHARRLIDSGTRVFPTSSVGRLFDAAAALLGFTREVTFEGQAAMWLEQIAGRSDPPDGPPVTYDAGELDFRPALNAIVEARRRGRPAGDIARGFHYALARGVADAVRTLCEELDLGVVVLSGGVFQNDLLLHDLRGLLAQSSLPLWVNRAVPPNDGGISLGQAALLMGGRA